MDYEKAYCPECDEGIAGHEMEWGGSSRYPPRCRRCGEEFDVGELDSISREGPHIHYCPSCEGILGTTPPTSDTVNVYYCPGCKVVLGIEAGP